MSRDYIRATGLIPLLMLTAWLSATPRAVCAADSNLELARRLNQAFVEVAEKVSPSVVVIVVTQKSSTPSTNAPNGGNDRIQPAPPDATGQRFHPFEPPDIAEASGIIIRKDGYILTNTHVVDNAGQIEVRLRDGRRFKAEIRGVDPLSDVAVIKIDTDDLPAVRFADSSKTRVGEFAIAIGAPYKLDYSVTFGHVSAKGRSNIVPAYEGGWAMDQDFIQTDANINPGNSGGPLINIEGEVIGINTLIRGLHTGIGFAIPSNLAREVADRLIADGKFTRAWLGIGIRSLKDSPDFQPRPKNVTDGVIVMSILPEGPSANSNLRLKDVITALDGKSVGTAQQLRNEMRGKKVGQMVTLKVLRGGRQTYVRVIAGESIETRQAAQPEPKFEDFSPSALGMTVHPLTPDLADQFGVTTSHGVIVVAVDRGSPAAEKGIQPGDVITAIGKRTISSPEEFADALRQPNLKEGIAVSLVRGGSARSEILKRDE